MMDKKDIKPSEEVGFSLPPIAVSRNGQDGSIGFTEDRPSEIESIHLFDGEFVDGIVSVLDADMSIRKSFIMSSKRTIREMKKLMKMKMLPPILTGELDDANQGSDEYYKEKIDAVSSRLQSCSKRWTKESGAECVDLIVDLVAPVIGSFDDSAAESSKKSTALFPMHIVDAYKKMIKDRSTNQFDEDAFRSKLSNEIMSSGLDGLVVSLYGTLPIIITQVIVGLDKYVDINKLIAFAPLLGSVVAMKKMVQSTFSGIASEKKLAIGRVMESLVSGVENLDNEVTSNMLNPDYGEQVRRECFETMLAERDNTEAGDGNNIGLEILAKLFELKDDPKGISGYVDTLWGSAELGQHEALQNAKKITTTHFKNLITYEKSLNSKMSLFVTPEERNVRAKAKEDYSLEMYQLVNLLDHARVVDQELNEGSITVKPLLEAYFRRISSKPFTRRQFLKGTAMGLGALTIYGLVHQYMQTGVSSEITYIQDELVARPKVAENENRVSPELANSIIAGQILESYGIDYSYDGKIMDPTNSVGTGFWLNEAGAHLLQINPSIFYNSLEDKSKNYESFLRDEYFPFLFSQAKRMGIDINVLLGITRISSENIGNEERQNEDVKQGRIQMVLGAFNWYLHREFESDLVGDTVKSFAYEAMRGPYDTARLSGQITLGMHDVELSEYARGRSLMPKETLDWYTSEYYRQSSALDSINDTRQTLDKIALNEIQASIIEFAFDNDAQELFQVFELLTDASHEDWEAIGLGEDVDFADIVHHTTRYSIVWKELCQLHGRDFDKQRIFEQSMENARDVFVNKTHESLYDSIHLLIGDQISNKKFRDWFKHKAEGIKGVKGVDKILEAYEHYETVGTYYRDDLAAGYREIAPKEYDWQFQVVTGLGYIKHLEAQVDSSNNLKLLASEYPLWKTLIATSVREISPFPLLVEDELDLPRMTEFGIPYNYEGVVMTINNLVLGLRDNLGTQTSEYYLRAFVDLLKNRRSDPNFMPEYVTDIAVWKSKVEPFLEKLDLQHYSSMWRTIDVMTAFLA